MNANHPSPKAPASSIRAGAVRLARQVNLAVSASAWVGLAGRVVVMLAGLLALAWVGRTATAAGPTVPVQTEAMSTDGGSPAPPANASAAAPAPQVTAPLAQSPPPTSGATQARASADDPVYLNHATAEELRRLPGVGPKRAEAILALRQRVGRFQRVEDLLRIKGVGRRTVRKWRPLLRLDAPDGGAPLR